MSSPGTLLIVEDDVLTATQIEDALKDAVYGVLPPARTRLDPSCHVGSGQRRCHCLT